ncbi:hypothetical protein [Stenotrophomonas maltophilia]|uniref:hypothetical protein n=1 Tax=Stenotrophomonas maltophilia TaxID=40324 RepID=UPI000B4C5AC9|nr:hypothetical protein [Stenotrophomonas maltophilia]OWQ67967.1 hypothetical protein CEE57_15970 [Stenotrophomonas maltophilia]QGL66588.1 hypothetical protein FEO86_04490 [Stenotrophomonas maltophilia]
MADQTTAGALPDAELQILRHALGVGEGGLERSYRSHFVTGPGGADHQHCMALVARGFMVRRAGNAITGGSDLFNVTQAGRAAVQEHTPPLPKLTRSQQRYQQFLRYDGGVTFGEYLRGWR